MCPVKPSYDPLAQLENRTNQLVSLGLGDGTQRLVCHIVPFYTTSVQEMRQLCHVGPKNERQRQYGSVVFLFSGCPVSGRMQCDGAQTERGRVGDRE